MTMRIAMDAEGRRPRFSMRPEGGYFFFVDVLALKTDVDEFAT